MRFERAAKPRARSSAVLNSPAPPPSPSAVELALESIESQRAAMYPGEPSYDPDLFLQYANGTIYNERQEPGDQYFCAQLDVRPL